MIINMSVCISLFAILERDERRASYVQNTAIYYEFQDDL